MLTVASYQGRTVVGRLERGEDLLEGLRAVCTERQIRGGVVTAIGALDTAVVTHYRPDQRAYQQRRPLAGPLEILSLQGNLSESEGELSIHLHVTLSRDGDNGVEVLGGRLVSGRVFSCEFCILALDDVLLRRAPDPGTGLRLWHQGFERDADGTGRVVEPILAGSPIEEVTDAGDASVPAAPARKVPVETSPKARRAAAKAAAAAKALAAEDDVADEGAPVPDPAEDSPEPTRRTARATGPTWDDVAEASAAAHREPAELPMRPDREARATDDDEPIEDPEEDVEDYVDLEPGDIVEHPKFGRCRVERVEGADEYVHVRLRNRNLVRLSLDVITLELIGSESGHQVFRARIG